MFNKWILGGVAFLIVFSVTCVLWYQHGTAPYRQDAAKSEQLLRQSEIAQKVADTDSEEQAAESVSSAESKTQNTEKMITGQTVSAVTNNNSVGKPQDVGADTPGVKKKKTKRVRMSSHGFGPYPKIPKGAPIAKFDESDDVDTELMLRVAVKAWNEGERFENGFTDGNTGRVYLNYPGVIYVEYSEEIDDETGEVSLDIISATGGASLSQSVSRSVLDGNTPAGYTLIDINDSGIDPYEYLDLP